MTASFVHLHLHTQFSLLDGANQIEPLVQQIKRFAQPAVAMTDHGNMFGAIEFYRKAKDAGVKPIIGIETYVAPGKMTAADVIGLCRDLAGVGIQHAIFNMPNVHELAPLETFGREIIPALASL